MSNALAISAVTAALQFYLGNVYSGLSTLFGGNVTVSSQAPDLVQNSLGTGSTLQNQVNLFLHQVTPNAAWRNAGLPSVGADGKSQLQNPPLALDLHYLLTAYGSGDWQAEALLGYALLMLHQTPILARDDIRNALNKLPASNPLNPLSTPLGSSGLADQIEMIKITPATLGKEEMAWLWTALKADYRPTFPFQVSLVLLQPQFPSTLALPVLTRNIATQSGPPPQLLQVQPPAQQAAAAPGDSVTVTGESLIGASKVALSNPRLGIQYVPFAPSNVTDTSISFTVPNDPTRLPAGIYSLSVQFTSASGTVLQSTNSVPMVIAPTILATPAPTAVANAAGTLVTLSCNPQALPNQTVSLIMGSIAVFAQPFAAATATLSFQFTPALPSGPYLARLQVEGVVSPVAVDWSATPPKFTGPMVTV